MHNTENLGNLPMLEKSGLFVLCTLKMKQVSGDNCIENTILENTFKEMIDLQMWNFLITWIKNNNHKP